MSETYEFKANGRKFFLIYDDQNIRSSVFDSSGSKLLEIEDKITIDIARLLVNVYFLGKSTERTDMIHG